MAKKKPKPQDEAFTAIAHAIGDYLASVGWTALVIGRPRIQQQPGAREFNYEFVIDFTGGKKK